MNKLTRSLLSGASLAALLGLPSGARAAASIVVSTTVPSVFVPVANSYDFIEITSTGKVTPGGIDNEGFIGVTVGLGYTDTGIEIDNGGFVAGTIVNNATIEVTHVGIVVDAGGKVGGNIYNLSSGEILVHNANVTSDDEIVGIKVFGTLEGHVYNDGLINVVGVGSGYAVGISADPADLKFTATNAHEMVIKQAHSVAGGKASAHATGFYVVASDNLQASIKNLDSIKVNAAAAGKTATAQAYGVFATNTVPGNKHGNVANYIDVSNDGLFQVVAKANATKDAKATATGALLHLSGAGNTQAHVAFTNHSQGDFKVHASGFGDSSVNARAVGIEGWAHDVGPGNNAQVQVHNSGNIDVLAFASAGTAAHAYATGISEIAGNAPVATAGVHNSSGGYMKFRAYALASKHASALANGIEQRVHAGNMALASVTNAGEIYVTAAAQATAVKHVKTARANASVDGGIFQSAVADFKVKDVLKNSDFISISANAHATAYTVANAHATVYRGIEQLAQKNGNVAPQTAQASLHNSGTVRIHAMASASGATTANAFASVHRGIHQFASATQHANAALVNSGNIDITAAATAKGTISAFATAKVSHGISQVAAHGNKTDSVALTNSGNIEIGAFALATGNGGPGQSAYAEATMPDPMIYQEVAGRSGALTASAKLINENGGAIDILAHAVANGSSQVEAFATIDNGIVQTVRHAANVTVKLSNAGVIHISAFGNAVAAGGATASALASADMNTGVHQYGNADGTPGAREIVSLTNSGTLDVIVKASAEGTTNVVANATIGFHGIFQQAGNGAQSALVSLKNSGNIAIEALAHASGDAYAHAILGKTQHGAGIFQSASVDAAGVKATATLTNAAAGHINITARATAYDAVGGNATATARMGGFVTHTGFGIHQIAGNASIVKASLVNSGTIGIKALANATATSGDAFASAFIAHGISQYAHAGNLDTSALAMLSNKAGGAIVIEAKAFASGTEIAKAHVAINSGIKQNAEGGGNSLVTLHNAGTIDIWSLATAKANGGNATANAAVTYGIYQEAKATNAPYVDAVNLTNDAGGVIAIEAKAHASGTSFASARATVYRGIEQLAEDGGKSTAKIVNSGTIDILAYATAIANSGDASAYAKIDDGIIQHASANKGGHTSAVVALTNNAGAVIAIIAKASAIASQTAKATALIDPGIGMGAEGGEIDPSASLINSGSMKVAALAKAVANSAFAIASISKTGIFQTVLGANETLAWAKLTNNAGGNIDILGIASAHGNAAAGAWGDVNYGIKQTVTNAGNVTAKFYNAGNIHITARGNAVANTGYATAGADIVTGVAQFASANNSPGSKETISLINSGVLDIIAKATATAVTKVWAHATISDYGIYQVATTNAQTALVSLHNKSGDLAIEALAYAKGDAKAFAVIGTSSNGGAILQSAHAASGPLASAMLTNNKGVIDIIAKATAFASAGGNATATAKIPHFGIHQLANGADVANVFLTNSGMMDIEAVANATAPHGGAFANATIGRGITQFANAGNLDLAAKATLSNKAGGDLVIAAKAHASGNFSAHAIASIGTGINQKALNGANNSAKVFNAGNLDVLAFATAKAAGNATAHAHIHSGIYQFAADGNSAIVNLTNEAGGIIAIEAKAHASGGGIAYGNAIVTHGISQGADGFSKGNAKLVNSGTIDVLAYATAIAKTGDATAYALIDNGIHQSALVANGDGLANVTLTNNAGAVIDIIAHASAKGTQSARAQAYIDPGVGQHAAGTGIDPSALMINSGNMEIAALANASANSAFATASLTKTGISQIVLGSNSPLAWAKLTNNVGGTIRILGVATAYGNAAAAAYGDVNYGIKQSVTNAGNVTAKLDNGGDIFIMAAGNAVAGTGIATAGADINTGIHQFVSANDAAGAKEKISLTNTGNIDIIAKASAFGNAHASAHATIGDFGIYQFATHEAQTAQVGLNNTGTIAIEALAYAKGDATAHANIGDRTNKTGAGIFQSASAAFSVLASAQITNAGTIDIIARATAVDNVSGHNATATGGIWGYGIDQVAENADTAKVSLKNTGSIVIEAIGNATAPKGDAFGNAYIHFGVHQDAFATKTDKTAAASFTNNNLYVEAKAHAAGQISAKALATIYAGVEQHAEHAGNASVKLVNSGNLDIIADASAVAAAGPAHASASVYYGIYQYASADYGNKTEARAAITNGNHGVIAIVASAAAKGDVATAHANIDNYGIDQYAYYGAEGRVSLVNSGTIDIEALAKATATTGKAYADGYMDYGINQIAYYASKTEAVSLTNEKGGVIDIAVGAHASGVTKATAYAIMYNGIVQEAYGLAGLASVKLDNEGNLAIRAHATALATAGAGGKAKATATGYYNAIYQTASAAGGGHTNAKVTLTNAGVLDIDVGANAKGTSAYAKAYLDDDHATYGGAIYQQAWYGDTNSAKIKNSGTLDIVARAAATGTAKAAFATAFDYEAIYQNVYGGTTVAHKSGVASITNDGGIIDIAASAHADGHSKATANAEVKYGIYQHVDYAGKNTARIDNSGNLDIVAIGNATAAVGPAKASAKLYDDIDQFATVNYGVNHTSAHATLTNSGTMELMALAKAHGTKATAKAFNSYGIYQDAWYGNVDVAKIDNSGAIGIEAIARATGTAKGAIADAFIKYGVFQSAYASYADKSAAAIITNHDLAIVASAEASGKAKATANATIDYGIYQVGEHAGLGTVKLDNNGNLEIAVIGNATAGTGKAKALASIADYGIYQFASADYGNKSAAVAEITNAGDLEIRAFAHASGDVATAKAYNAHYVSAIYQEAKYGKTDSVSLKNSGNIGIDATAIAHADNGKAFASATIGYNAIYQHAFSATTQVHASITNKSGLFDIVAHASATGVAKATANAFDPHPIVQIATAGNLALATKATASFVNGNGSVLIENWAYAKADGNPAFAHAHMQTGIYQSAAPNAGNGAVAIAQITNSGEFDIINKATATGTKVTARATITEFGIYQHAHDADTAQVGLKNSGNFEIAALAHAQGDAKAVALIGNGVYQLASVTNNHLAATATLTNAGNFGIMARATAYAPVGLAKATGTITNDGIYQGALKGDNVKATITNSGNLDIIAWGNASAAAGKAVAQGFIGNGLHVDSAGIYQKASAATDGDTAKAIIDNSGTIFIAAEAFAHGYTKATATAHVHTGIGQYALNAGVASAKLTGNGVVDILADASAVALHGPGLAKAAIIHGIYQTATASKGAHLSAIASISVDGGAIEAIAKAKGTKATATASIISEGIAQQALYGNTVHDGLKNSGAFDIAAIATASTTGTEKGAKAKGFISVGVSQLAQAGHGNILATVNLTNAQGGTFNVIAEANAFGHTKAAATAHMGTGLWQYANNAGNVSVGILNSGNVEILVAGNATADAGKAKAAATMVDGVFQDAESLSGTHAAAALTNSGNFNIVANANASASESAKATAQASITMDGVFQHAHNADTATVGLKNAGDFEIAAFAHADGDALAKAYIKTGHYQLASVTGLHLKATATLTNGGNFDIIAKASVTAPHGAATASGIIDNYGIYQRALNADRAKASISNAGTLVIGAVGNATALDGKAKAHAYIGHSVAGSSAAIYQKASAAGADLSAEALIDNSGSISIFADAFASGTSKANATASVLRGIDQFALHGGQDSAELIGNGVVDILANAIALASDGKAVAGALMLTGIHQSATANFGNHASAVAAINIDGGMIGAMAKASGTTAKAVATIDNFGVRQIAKYGDQDHVSLKNNGDFEIIADASAIAGTGKAIATAYLQLGIDQYAYASNAEKTAAAHLTNDGGMLGVVADAIAHGQTKAVATANLDRGIVQSALDAAIVTAAIYNSGDVSIFVGGNAVAQAGTARADAHMHTGVFQTAVSLGGPHANVALTNTGNFDVILDANASAPETAPAKAHAGLTQYGIYQHAHGADTDVVGLKNSGDLEIAALAHAYGDALARADIQQTGIYQLASATGKHLAATATITNASAKVLEIIAKASATAPLGNATALGIIHNDGINQRALGGDHVLASIANSGSLAIAAIGNASAVTGFGNAHAFINHKTTANTAAIYQKASAAGKELSADAIIDNSGSISIAALAHAVGNSAQASASVLRGIDQFALHGGKDSAKLTGNGVVEIAAEATALAVHSAAANALMLTGIFQSATAKLGNHTSAVASISVDGGLIGAIAKATGTTANATAKIDEYGVRQKAYYGDKNSASLKNTGNLDIVAKATATADLLGAKASAFIDYGIAQYVHGSHGNKTGTINLTNEDPVLAVVASAHASAVTSAKAHAELLYGIYQSGVQAGKDIAKIYNTGTMDVIANASAKAADYALATAYLYDAIEQVMTGYYGGHSEARATLTNSGNVDLLAIAHAQGASGTAKATNYYGLLQYAEYADTNVARIDNSGSLVVAALANATGTKAYATADAFIENGIYQEAFADAWGNVSAAAKIANTGGNMDIAASARASGKTHASANAGIHVGLEQYAHYAGFASAQIAGGGMVEILAKASAVSPSETAKAAANVEYGIYQYALADYGLKKTALAQISVSGGGVQAVANASGKTGATATAKLTYYGVYQEAADGSTDKVSFVNNSGSFFIGAVAMADAVSNAAHGNAVIDYGIYQYAYASNAKNLASANLTNKVDGTFDVVADAGAKGSSKATAGANLSYAIEQYVENGKNSKAKLDNEGVMMLEAVGNATATAGTAKAYAFMKDGIYQEALYNGVKSAVATASLVNAGVLDIVAQASASGTTHVKASAIINNYAIYQNAHGDDEANVSLHNSGTLDIMALAFAKSDAYANALIAHGISQAATAGNLAQATLSNENENEITIMARATANALAGPATAAAHILDGIYQVAKDALVDTAGLYNSGNLEVAAIASVAAQTAKADALIQTVGIGQVADANAGKDSLALATLTNQGNIDILVMAKATGTNLAKATANIANTGIYQRAYNADSATAYLSNAGTIEVGAIAHAKGDATAVAHISAEGLGQHATATNNKVAAAATFSNAGNFLVTAFASALGTAGGPAKATGYIRNGINQQAHNGSLDTVLIDNTGTLLINAGAFANGGVAHALATIVNAGIEQIAEGAGNGMASAAITNDSDVPLNIMAHATAIGKASAVADAYIGQGGGNHAGIYQRAADANNANVTLRNDTVLNIAAVGNATATGVALANAKVNIGIFQSAETAHVASLSVANISELFVHATANAHGGKTANAFALVDYGIEQTAHATKTASDTVDNSDVLEFYAAADAVAKTGKAKATAIAYGVTQFANAGHMAEANFTNEDNFEVFANAHARGATAGTANARAYGGYQSAVGGAGADAEMVNSSDFFVMAVASGTGHKAVAVVGADGFGQNARATGHAKVGFLNTHAFGLSALGNATAAGAAKASVKATGLYQGVALSGTAATASFVNDGSFHVRAFASGNAGKTGTATAIAVGVHQTLKYGGKAIDHNTDTFIVNATASAFGTVKEKAVASAFGVVVDGSSSAAIALDILNTGSFDVRAKANDASAVAGGVEVVSGAHGKVSGKIENDSAMFVSALAPGGKASAAGIGVFADQFNGTIINNSVVHVLAEGKTAEATGIAIGGEGNPTHSGTGKIVNQGATIWAGVKDGAVTLRGSAIDVSGAPNAIEIDLQGHNQDGNIYGDIKLSSDNNDIVKVFDGETIFNGGINPAGGHYGTLQIGAATSPGTLDLVNDPLEGQSYGNLNFYDQHADGTLVLNVTPNPDPNFVFFHANNATLGGTVLLNLQQHILYPDSTIYRVVIDDVTHNAVVGEWADIETNLDSMFLHPVQVDPTPYEADIELVRAAFNSIDAVPSLADNPNELAVATGIENAYSTQLTGPYASLVEALLFMNDENLYQNIMDELADEEAGELAMATVDASEVLKDAISAHLQATMGGGTMLSQLPGDISPAAGSAMSKGALWGGAFGQWGKLDNTVSGPGFNNSDEGFVAGGDMPVNANTTIGVAGAWTAHGTLHFNNGASGTYDGIELGAYARYNDDANRLYLQGVASYGMYSNSTRRFVSVPDFGAGWIKGNYNSHIWQLYGEAGVHVTHDSSVDLVPYAALDYLKADSNTYTEHGLPGANLRVSDASSTSFSSYLGAKLSILNFDMSGGSTITPTFKLAWQHQFDHNIWQVNAAFAGVPASAFTVTGAALAKDSVVAGAEVAMSFGDNVDAVLNYDARFDVDRQINTVLGRLNFKF